MIYAYETRDLSEIWLQISFILSSTLSFDTEPLENRE